MECKKLFIFLYLFILFSILFSCQSEITKNSYNIKIENSFYQLVNEKVNKSESEEFRIVIVKIKPIPKINDYQLKKGTSIPKSIKNLSYNQRSELAQESSYIKNCKKVLSKYGVFFSGDAVFKTRDEKGIFKKTDPDMLALSLDGLSSVFLCHMFHFPGTFDYSDKIDEIMDILFEKNLMEKTSKDNI